MIRITLNHWREPLACFGHEPSHQHTPWRPGKHFAIGPLIALHEHNHMRPGVKAYRIWLYTRAGGRLIDVHFVPRAPDAAFRPELSALDRIIQLGKDYP